MGHALSTPQAWIIRIMTDTADDSFELFDLKVEAVIPEGVPIYCGAKAGDYFELRGEMLTLPAGQGFSIYSLASVLPLLAAKQRPTHRNDWMTSDAEIACPDPNCGSRLRISRLGLRRFSHAQTTAVPLPEGISNEERPSARKVASIAHFRPESAVEMPLEGPILQTETRLDRIFDPNSFHRAAFTSGEPPRPTLFSDLWTSPMTFSPSRPDRTELASGLEISRVVTGLWQVADMERSGALLDPQVASSAMLEYAAAGFDTFDMADHYGSAEIIAGRFLARVAAGEGSLASRPAVFTKWCPKPGPMTMDIVREGVERSLQRLGVKRIDLMQFHWWTFEHPGYLDAMKGLAQLRDEGVIGHIGVTNFDTAHLRVLVKHGIPISTCPIPCGCRSARRARGRSAPRAPTCG